VDAAAQGLSTDILAQRRQINRDRDRPGRFRADFLIPS
jgi:hypothetical protein